METVGFKTDYIEQEPVRTEMDYVRKIDTLFLDFGAPNGPRSTYYIADGVHIVYDPQTMQIAGFRVEDWTSDFLRLHRDLRRHWYSYRLRSLMYRLLRRQNVPMPDAQNVLQTVTRYTPSHSFT